MDLRDLVIQRLVKLGINKEVLNRYDEPHRFYHNWEHIEKMLYSAMGEIQTLYVLNDSLFLAIVFHDIIYDPKANDNEEKSAELFSSYMLDDEIANAILDTKTHKPTGSISEQLCKLDLEVLYGDFQSFVDFENKIFKEYQFVDYKIYKEKRIEILQSLNTKPEFINYVKSRTPNIAVYAGSFNPFHKGHYNILQKAEQIFDKVIIAKGDNPTKQKDVFELPSALQYRQVEHYQGLLTEFIDSLQYPVTLVRGLRNSTDFEYELTQYKFLQDLTPDIKVVNLFCDREYEHISGSAIRQLKTYNKETNYII